MASLRWIASRQTAPALMGWFFVMAMMTGLSVCSKQKAPVKSTSRLEPTLSEKSTRVTRIVRQRKHLGFALWLVKSDRVTGPLRLRVRVLDRQNRQLPYQLFGCGPKIAQQKIREIRLVPPDGRSCNVFVADARAVSRIQLVPKGAKPLDVYRHGDTIGVAGSFVLPTSFSYRR